MNQLTKGVVIASTLAAGFVQLYLATRLLYPELFFIVTAAFMVALVAGSRLRGTATAVVLAASYLAPAAYVIWAGFENYGFEIVWSLPLLGLIISGREAWRWHLPTAWRWPLVTWALVIAASWPLVFLREVDFFIGLLPMRGVANTSIGITPWDAVTAVTYWTLVHNIGLLWFDRLFGWFIIGHRVSEHPGFRATVLLPLMAAGVVSVAVGIYQAFVDIHFLNPHLWPHMKRASGTLGDANTYGIIAALWGPASVVLAQRLPAPWAMVAGLAGASLGLAGVLTSGSRTAIVAIAIGFAAVMLEGLRALRRPGGAALTLRRLVPMVGGVLVLLVVVVLVAQGSSITSIAARGVFQRYLPGFGELSISQTLHEILWDRFSYGPAAVQMITEHPLAGVGVGAFHTLVHDFSIVATGREIVPDNAQSWYRHHLAELGLAGSLPLLAWCVIFGAGLLSKTPNAADGFGVGVLRACLIAFGAISLLGVPGQSMPVALTFWALAFWFASLKGMPASGPEPWRVARWGPTLLLVVLHAGITLADARGDLLPRNRSMRFGWPYQYGLSNLEPSADGSPGRRWTELNSLAVLPVQGQVLKFVGWIDHPDADERPVHVRVWADSRLVWDDDLQRSAAIFLDITPSQGKTHLIIETEISRMWRPTDFGRDDRRLLGLSVRDWAWQ